MWQWVGGQAIESLSFAVICPLFYSLSLWRILQQERYSRRRLNSDDDFRGACLRCSCACRKNSEACEESAARPLSEMPQSVQFTQFKRKLFMVPFIFVFIRTWSETRTIILAVNPELDAFWLQVDWGGILNVCLFSQLPTRLPHHPPARLR